ncbi:MAG: carboxylesterase family protein [Lachnospiraceae bacterium]|nr:carboxylesterase family protein [Lachnospiraceae bacterium]
MLFSILLLLMLALLELNKNRLIGWILVLALSAVFFYVYRRFLKTRPKWMKCLSYVGWIGAFALLFFLTWPPVKAVPAVSYGNPDKTGIVHVANGDVQGVVTKDGEVEIYAGIPYAKPPVGELRWKEPQDPDNWEGVLAADHFAPMSMQPVNSPIYDSLAQIIGYHDYRISLSDNYVAPVSEDSLYVNVWKPAGEVKDLPVVVYVHGGSLKTGQPWYADYSGEGLARKDVVVVNMGYRLGVFGFLATQELAAESANNTTGNYGLLDQIKALTWVQENIVSFGGDPGNVTLAGESAGSACVSALCVSPLAKGLFRRAVLESSTVAPVSPTHSFRLFDEALLSGKTLMHRYQCNTTDALRALDAKTLVDEAETQHHITVDGYVLEKTPYESYLAGEYNEEALLHGYNRHEADAFLIFDHATLSDFPTRVQEYFGSYSKEVMELYPAQNDKEARAYWSEIWGAVFFDYPHYCLNRLEVLNQVPVYQYYFTKDNGRLGPWHSGEEVYLYGNIPDGSGLYSAYDRELSNAMLQYYVNFAYNGDPNGGTLPVWKENRSSSEVMEFGDNFGMIPEREHALFAILDAMQGYK